MENTTYYSPKKNKLIKFFKKNKGRDEVNNSNGESIMQIATNKKNAFLKKIGATSGIALVLIGVLALVVFLVIIKPAYAVIDVTTDLKRDWTDLQDALITRDLVLFAEVLDTTEDDLKRVAVARDSNFSWMNKIGLTKGYYEDSDYFLSAGQHAINAAREFAVLVEPFSEAAGFKVAGDEDLPTGHTGFAEAVASWIGVMPEVAANMDGVIEEFAAMGEDMKNVDASRYPESFFGQPVRPLIETAQNSLAGAGDYGPDIKEALGIIPDMLGVGTGTKRYAIIMQNDKEIRATGGFWTNYATFKVQNALLQSDFTSKDMYSIDFTLDVIDPYTTFPTVPPTYNKYLKVERMFARDANVSPDFPTAVDQWLYFYNLGNQIAPWDIKPIDGIIAMDTQVVKELLEVTGPVNVNGVTFNADNVVLELEKIASLSLTEQANRKGVLGDLMEGMLVNVFESNSNLWPKLVDKAIDLVRRKHIIINMFNEDSQALLEKYKLAGRIIDPVEGDYAFPVQTNLGGDKTNLFVTKEVTHELKKENGRWMKTVTIEYTYGDSAPEFAELVKVFRDWMRLYVPLGSELISVEGSVDEAGEGEERNKTYFHGFTILNPGEKSKMVFKYYLPDGVITGDTYTLYVQKQPGINTEVHNVIVNGKKQTETIDTDTIFTAEL